MIKQFRVLFFVLAIGSAISCTAEQNLPDKSQIIGLGSTVVLELDTTSIITADFFIDPSLIDSVFPPTGMGAVLSPNREEIRLIGQPDEPLSVLEIWADGFPYHLLLKKSGKENITITFEPQNSNPKTVQVKGEFNNWNAASTPLTRNGNVWQANMLVNRGVYQYVFVVDGVEMPDPSNPENVSNGMGGTNSILRVGKESTIKPHLTTQKHAGSLITLTGENVDQVIAFWENHRIDVSKADDYFTFVIPRQAAKKSRSHIRVWGFSGDALSNDILIPLKNRDVVSHPDQLTRLDYYGWNMYFVLIDRFKDGNPANTKKVDDPDIHPKANYYGGDFAGITQKIKDGYFDKIGVNTLWLSPISQNPEGAYGLWDKGGVTTKFSGYHGYWPVSSSKVDYRFGTADEFRELLDVAHEKDMNVILDYVANHVHEEHPVYQQNKDWATDLYLPDGSLNTERWDDHRLTTWFDTFMPTLDFSRPEVIETMTDSALYWVKEFELDGFRHDATKHIQLEFWRTLTRKVKDSLTIPTGKQVFQIGETYGSRELIASYINSGMLHSQFDFNIYDAALNTFGKDDSFDGLVTQLQESFKYYGYHNLMGYISGNHDKTRFITLTSGEVSWDEDGKLAGWTREIEDPQAFAYNRLSMFHAFNQTIPGIPVTYQGDEFGQPGANDPDNRRWMQFEEDELSSAELRNRNIFSELTHIRKENMPLLYGDFKFLSIEEDQLAYSRSYFGDQVIVAFNKSSKQEELNISLRPGFNYSKLQAHFGSDFLVDENNLKLTLPPNGFEILILK